MSDFPHFAGLTVRGVCLAVVLAACLIVSLWGASVSWATSQPVLIPNRWTCSTGDASSGCVSVTLAPMPTGRARLAVATGQDGRVYALGGCTDPNCATPVGAVEVYDPNTNTWACSVGDLSAGCTSTSIPAIPTARDGLVAAVGPGGQIYAIGGENGTTQVYSNVEAYDPSTNAWACSVGDLSPGCSTLDLAPMPTARARLALVVGKDGKFYAFGGCNQTVNGIACGNSLPTIEVYDPNANTWTCSTDDTSSAGCTTKALAPMPTPRSLHGGALGPDNRIYAIGGWDGLTNVYSGVETYDPIVNAWTTESSLSAARFGLGAVTGADGRIYAIGGCSGITDCNALSSVEAYSTKSGTWTASTRMPTARGRLAATMGPDRHLYALGGYANSTRLSTVEAFVVPLAAYLPSVSSGSPQ